MSAFPSFSQFAMNPLQREYVMIALLGAGLETRPPHASCEKDTAGHGPRKTEKRYLGSTLLDFIEGGMVSGGIPFSFRTSSAVGESVLFDAGQSILTCLPLFLTLE
jgi:hypothetical protein